MNGLYNYDPNYQDMPVLEFKAGHGFAGLPYINDVGIRKDDHDAN
jgi:hypothetical protein